MTRRLICLVLVVVAVSTPALAARRRAVTPGSPGHCKLGTVAYFASPFLFTKDATHVYWIDDFDAKLFRAPLDGGEVEDLGASFNDYVTWAMTTDATTVYIAASPTAIIDGPAPGFILTVPKNGGALATLVSGVSTPLDVEADDTHVYWAAAGTLDFPGQHIPSDGKIERVRKDGSARQALVEDLSTPVDVELEGDQVWYGETGFADDDPTVGVYRVAKTGGAVTTLNATVIAPALAVTNDAVIVEGGTATVDGGIIRVPKDGSAIRVLAQDENITGAPVVFDGRVYYITEGEEANSLFSVPLDGSATARLVRDDLYYISNFFVDECAITAALENANIERFAD